MSLFSTSPVRMRFASEFDQEFVPEWRKVYYDHRRLFELVELMECASFEEKEVRNMIVKQRMELRADYLHRVDQKLLQIIKGVDRKFVEYYRYQKQKAFVFVQMKYLELKAKFERYKVISSTSDQIYFFIFNNFHCKDKYRGLMGIQEMRDRKTAFASPFEEKEEEVLKKQMEIIWENLYIEIRLLRKLIIYNDVKETQILSLHGQVVDSYMQFERLSISQSQKKFQELSSTLQLNIEKEIKSKKLYWDDHSEGGDDRFKQLSLSIDGNRKANFGEMDGSIVLFGLWCGMILALVASLVVIMHIKGIDLENNQEFEKNFPIWRGVSYFIFYLWCIGFLLMIFEVKEVNYKIIFSIDEIHVPKSFGTLIVAATFSTFYIIAFVVYVATLEFNYLQFLPGVLWLVMLFVLFNPFPILEWRSRLYGVKILFLVIVSPFNCYGTVDFKIQWFTENLVSFKQPFRDFIYTVYFYLIDPESSYDQALIIGEILTMSIFFWRILQGLKKGFFEEGVKYFSETNILPRGAIKCSFAILAILFSLLYRQNQDSTGLLVTWVVVAIVATLYIYHFDLYFDWGLLRNGCGEENPLLSNNLIFPPRVYYLIMGLNFFLRCTWVLNISTGIVDSLGLKPYVFVMILAYLEIVRRNIWNLLKIENEYLNRCKEFQAIVNDQQIQNYVYENNFKSKFRGILAKVTTIKPKASIKEQYKEVLQTEQQTDLNLHEFYEMNPQEAEKLEKFIEKLVLNSSEQILEKQRKQALTQLLRDKIATADQQKLQLNQFLENQRDAIDTYHKHVSDIKNNDFDEIQFND